jgi:FMN-dependent NADH-azoreductase
MTTLLHIDSSIQGEGSVTRQLTKAIVADLRSKQPDLQVHYLNLATRPLTHLVLDLLPSDHPLAGAGMGGPEGLMGGKRVIVAVAAGGFYGAETPQAPAEHVRSYLGAVFAVIGITPQFIVAEGVQHGAEHRQTALNNAYSAIRALQPA